MDPDKRQRLKRAGFRVGSAAEFLELTPAESALVEARLALSNALRARRKAQNLSQAGLAKRLNSSQSRVAKIEAGDPSVSLDLMARAFLETGATLEDLGRAISINGLSTDDADGTDRERLGVSARA
jgi:DNA-binding XRE family transcriptional regulator